VDGVEGQPVVPAGPHPGLLGRPARIHPRLGVGVEPEELVARPACREQPAELVQAAGPGGERVWLDERGRQERAPPARSAPGAPSRLRGARDRPAATRPCRRRRRRRLDRVGRALPEQREER
jgi:hypothetical protein